MAKKPTDDPDWMFKQDNRLLANGWQAYAEFANSQMDGPPGDPHRIAYLMNLQMAFFAGIGHTLRILNYKQVKSPLIDDLWEQWNEMRESMNAAAAMFDASFPQGDGS